MKKIPYGKHFIDKSDIEAVVKVLESDSLTQGPIISEYEKKFANYVGSKYAVSVSSCSAGLHLSAIALNLKQNDYFVTSPITFVSSAAAGLHIGANVIFCDIDINTINISLDRLEEIIKLQNIKLIIPVHFAGLPCDMSKLNLLKNKYGFKILEDAAHALGSSYSNGQKVGSGSHSDACVFSTHPVKTIATGEGGMITTNDEKVYKSLLRLRSHGINKEDDQFINKENAFSDGKRNLWYYEMRELGYHYRITDIQAALGISQLNKIDSFIKKRKDIVNYYNSKLHEIPNCNNYQKTSDLSSNHIFVISLDLNLIGKTKNDIMREFRDYNIITQVHYMPLPMHPYFNKLGYSLDNIPNAVKYFNNALSIPCYYSLSFDDQKFVIDAAKKILKSIL